MVWRQHHYIIEESSLGQKDNVNLASHEYRALTCFTGGGAIDAMIEFSAPFRGWQVMTPLGSEQTTSSLVVLITHRESRIFIIIQN